MDDHDPTGWVDPLDRPIALKACTDEIRMLIRKERNDQAITLGRHVLRFYPKHVETYRQMAEAYLEKGDLESAQELFRRVLSADPENVVAHAGLAVVFEQMNLHQESLWHFERAYELAPANSEIRKELIRLYSEIEGKPHSRLKLTRGALARLYVLEGLYPQAIEEFRALSEDTPKRMDVRVGLAEALWRTGRTRTAAELAQTILETLPYCLKANLILGTAWNESGIEESETFLQRAQALDPDNVIAHDLVGTRLREAVLPRYVPGKEYEPGPALDWFTPESPVESVAPAISAEPTSETFEFETKEPAEELPITLEATEPEETEELEAEVAPTIELDKTEPVPAQEEEKETRTDDVDQSPWLGETARVPAQLKLSPRPTIVSASLPPWLIEDYIEGIDRSEGSLHPEETDLQETPFEESPPPAEKTEQEELPASVMPIWLAEASQAAPQQGSREGEMPPVAQESASPADQATSQDLSFADWLQSAEALQKSLTADQEASGADLWNVSEASQATEETPDWLQQSAPAVVSDSQVPLFIEERIDLPGSTESTFPSVVGISETSEAAEPPAPEIPQISATPSIVEEPQALSSVPPAEPASPEIAAPAIFPTEDLVLAATQPEEALAEASHEELAAPAPSRRRAAKGSTHLELARAWRDANRLGDALLEYAKVIEQSPQLVDQVIADLEQVAQWENAPLESHRVLGDAYSRADRLAEALEQYRFVLGHVS